MGKKRKNEKLDMREYVQSHLDLWGLGRLIAVQGPERGGRHNNESWYQLIVKYRRDESATHLDDGRIEIYLGATRHGGYLNRRSIRIAIAKVGREHQGDIKAEQVWSSAQKAITSGRAIEL